VTDPLRSGNLSLDAAILISPVDLAIIILRNCISVKIGRMKFELPDTGFLANVEIEEGRPERRGQGQAGGSGGALTWDRRGKYIWVAPPTGRAWISRRL
jgi:hypothetical protein